jgi:hypothetical protein
VMIVELRMTKREIGDEVENNVKGYENSAI